MSQFTVRRALQVLAKYNGQNGTCWDDPSNLDRLNRVRENMYDRGDFQGAVDWICVNVKAGCFYLPIEYVAIRTSWLCQRAVQLNSRFYSVLNKGAAQGCGPMSNAQISATGKVSPFFVDLNQPVQVVARCSNEEDQGKKIWFWGTDQSTDKKEIVLSLDEVAVSGNVFGNFKVSKEVTDGYVHLFAIAGYDRMHVASYPGAIEIPRYIQYSTNIENGKGLVLCVKKNCVPLTDHDQIVDIESLTALEFGYQAMNKQDEGDDAGYVSKTKLAYEALNKVDINLQIETSSTGAIVQYQNYALP